MMLGRVDSRSATNDGWDEPFCLGWETCTGRSPAGVTTYAGLLRAGSTPRGCQLPADAVEK